MNIMDKINDFRDERDWRQFHNEKDLALSITLEAAELLEIFQWKSAKEGIENIEGIKEELADILIYSLMLADNLNLNVEELIESKLQKNSNKYPVEKSKGSKEKYTKLQ